MNLIYQNLKQESSSSETSGGGAKRKLPTMTISASMMTFKEFDLFNISFDEDDDDDFNSC